MRTLGFADFAEFATEAMGGRRPYPYQQRLAAEGLPELLRVPPGTGKTAAAVLPWLWRRMRFPASTPDRLVYVLPLRSMFEQIERQIAGWLGRLGLAPTVPVITLLPGEQPHEDDWRFAPHHPVIMLGTQDVVVSRLLMRGYGEWRPSWPVTFGLLHCSSQFVFDETDLLGPALGTSLQLQGLRDKLGSAHGSATMWMSATAEPADLVTPDHPGPARVIGLTAADRADKRLARRLGATRVVRRAALPADPVGYPVALAGALAAWHVPGTATIAVLNTAERARAVFDALQEAAPAADLLLLHAGWRPQERSLTAARLDTRLPAAGRIVVATQVLEACVDTTCQTMFTESAPWSSIMQRAALCDRDGDAPDAVLVWAPPPAADPYDAASVAAAQDALASFEGTAVTFAALRGHHVTRYSPRARYPVLSQADLLRLFDTAPPGGTEEADGADRAGRADRADGADIDVTPWVRDGNDLTALVAWRSWPDGRPAADEPAPGRDELCPVPLAGLRQSGLPLWIWDIADNRWRGCVPGDVRHAAILLADAALGGYLPGRGWSPGSKAHVPTVRAVPPRADDPPGSPRGDCCRASAAAVQAVPPRGDDPPGSPRGECCRASAAAVQDQDAVTSTGYWVDLCTHLADAERELRALTGDTPAERGRRAGLTAGQLEAAALAARWHDLGKASRYFQEYLRSGSAGEPPGPGPWAKSPGRGGHPVRPFLRHELMTVLALLHPRCGLLDGVPEPDLVAYLAGAHHGKLRLNVRPMPGEAGHDPPRLLGVRDGDELPPVSLPGDTRLPALMLDTTRLIAWPQRVRALLERPDLGPFRLAYLEALVRIADWRASRHPSAGTPARPQPLRSLAGNAAVDG